MNKRHIHALFVSLAALLFAAATQAGTVTPALQEALAGSGSGGDVPVLIKFADQLDIEALKKEVTQTLKQQYLDPRERKAKKTALKRSMLVDGLKKTSKDSLKNVAAFLKQQGENNVKLKSLWAINAVSGSVPAYLVEDLADLADVESVTLDATVQGPGNGSAPTAPTNWNLDAVGAPALWQLGHTGMGMVVATMDSGVDASHPDLGPRWRGGSNSWFDPNGQHATPADVTGHGTRVLGLIVGGAAGGYQIGMAPDAQWIAAKIFDNSNEATLSGIHQAYQWLLDPDGDLATNDAPDIVNNSWVLEGTTDQCNQEFSGDLTLLKAAEITVVFSAGNYGPKSKTSLSPANDPVVVSVGSVDDRLKIARSSSRGAGACDGGIYPHLVAPGENVLTTDLMPGFYNVVSGTSFSVAHVSGAMALLKSAFPTATATQLESSLINTAVDLGNGGADNTFGYGLMDVVGAHDWLDANLGGDNPGSLQLSAASYSIDENVTAVTVNVTRTNGSTGDVAVDYATADGTAAAGQDYQATSGTLTLADGVTSDSFSVTLLDDGEHEANEDFMVTLGNPQGGATLGTPQNATVTIVDNDPLPEPGTLAFASATYSVVEDGVTVLLSVTRSNGSAGIVTVDYATSDGTATGGVDYTGQSGTLTFQDGEVSNSITITINDDTDYEGDENFTVTLSNPLGGATLGSPNAATVNIQENDTPPGPADDDGDGFTVDVDCDDSDTSVYPGAPEVRHDGIDQDCNGYDLTIEITQADYIAKQDKVVVWATSALAGQAGLSVTFELASGGSVSDLAMIWKGRNNRWETSIKRFASKYGASPVSVTVSGGEGTVSAPVQ